MVYMIVKDVYIKDSTKANKIANKLWNVYDDISITGESSCATINRVVIYNITDNDVDNTIDFLNNLLGYEKNSIMLVDDDNTIHKI